MLFDRAEAAAEHLQEWLALRHRLLGGSGDPVRVWAEQDSDPSFTRLGVAWREGFPDDVVPSEYAGFRTIRRPWPSEPHEPQPEPVEAA
jgi:hypothetical protein